MTPEERAELRRWLAVEVMGWELYEPEFKNGLDHSSWTMKQHKLWYLPRKDWHPDTDLKQAFMVEGKMREKGWHFRLYIAANGCTIARFWFIGGDGRLFEGIYETANPQEIAFAICLATKAAKEGDKP